MTAKNTSIYKVRDTEGRVQAEHHHVKKGNDKDCYWRLPDSDKWGLQGRGLETLPLYGAHMADGWEPDGPVIVAEGEKAAQALIDAGFDAVGTVTGASLTPGPETLEVLRDRVAILFSDNDDAGRAHMQRVAEGLQGVAAEVLVYTWHEAPEKGDAADHPAILSGDRKALDRLLQDFMEAPRWEPSKPPRRTMTAAELLGMELPEVRWAVPDLLPQGVTILAGKPKLGKSWLALDLCVAVAAGGYALGKKKVEWGSALYLGLEDNTRRLKSRLKKLLGEQDAPDGLEVSTDWLRLNEGGAEALDAWLIEHPDARLVVIDTLAKVRPASRGHNVYADDYASLERLLPIAAKHGVAIVVVHHTRKMAAADPLDELSGSTGLSGGVDGVLVLRRDRGRADAYLSVTGRDIEEEAELALTWDQTLASWTLAGDADDYRVSRERATVLDVMAAGEPMTPTQVAELIESAKPNAMKKLLRSMAQDGQLTNDGGRYSLPNHGNPGNPGNRRDEGRETRNGYRESRVTTGTTVTADGECLEGMG